MAPEGPDGLSVIVHCWSDATTDSTHLRIERIDRQEEIHLNDGTFLVRVAIDRGRLMERCFIRHIPSGREAYVQGGPGLSAFIKDSLLSNAANESKEQTN